MDDVTATEPAEATTSAPPAHHRSFVKELPFLVVVAFLLALLIKGFLVQAFYIPSGSMEQTLGIGDRVLVNKVVYHLRGIHRGEIVVFNGLNNFEEPTVVPAPSNGVQKALRKVTGILGGSPDEKDYIKRVIGLPGDRVMCCDAGGRVTVQDPSGRPAGLDEPYIFLGGSPDDDRTKYFCAAGQGPAVCPPGAPGLLVPPGRLWVMGDHRNNSADSRAHYNDDANHGTVPEDKVVGRAFVVVYPLSHATVLHVPGTFDRVTPRAR